MAWRNARYTEELSFTDEADKPVNLSGYSAALQVRLYGAQPGAAIISLPNVANDTQGVRVIEPLAGTLAVRIDEATLAGEYDRLAGGIEPGGCLPLKYDLVLTPPEGGDEVWMQGEFIINPGITV